jgi:hypothetical protein
VAKKDKKLAAKAISRPDEKKPQIREVSRADSRPSWRFSTVDRDGPFKWPVDEVIEAHILRKLHDFDSMRWSDIEGPKHHFLDISGKGFSKEAKDRLQEIGHDDAPGVFSFHFSGKCRIIGLRDGAAINLLWFDAEHQVWPSELKNT